MARFDLQHLDRHVRHRGAEPTACFTTMYEAKAHADALWEPGVTDAHQSIIDTATNQSWRRGNGDRNWHFERKRRAR